MPPYLKALIWTVDKIVDIKPQLEEMGLCISSGHIGFAYRVNPADVTDAIIQEAQETGIRHFLTSLTFDTKEKTEICAEQISEANRKLNPHGITLGYHNHDMEFHAMDDGAGLTLMDHFLSVSDEKVKIELDTGWQMYVGNDVLAFMQKYWNRIQAVHLKDFVNDYLNVPKDDAFAAMGDGALPTKKILEFLQELNLFDYGLMINQDKAAKGAGLQEDLEKGMEYLKSIGVSEI